MTIPYCLLIYSLLFIAYSSLCQRPSMSTAYTRRVSFDSLNPSIQVEPDEPIHIPPQYSSRAKTTSSKRTLDLNFGYEPSSKHQDLYKVFDSFQEINNKGYKSNLSTTRRKIPKLPPPPNKSILKRSVDDVQDQGAAIPKSFNENDQQNSFASVLPSQQRKKSLVEMTAEELLAMDAQFRTGVNLDEFKFDGDNYLPFHNLSSIDSKKPKNGLPNIDKLVGNIVTVNNRKLLKTNSINFNSYTVSFRHRLMTKFIDQTYESFETDEEEDEEEDDERPESLRELIVYISGRRHTWDSINWVLKNFLVDGDHLVIISQLPPENNSNVDYKDELIDCDFIKSKADALSSYIFKAIELLNKQDLKISITIEFIKDSSVKNLIKNSINLYNPNFFIISSLISNRLSIRFENNHVKLPYYLMKNLNLSTIIIPDLLIEKNLISLDQNIPEINIETDDDDYITTSYFLHTLNQISDAYKSIELNQLKSDISLSSTSNSNSNSRSDSRSTNQANNQEYADTPTNYYPKIKFSDNLSIPKYNNSNPSNSSSPFSSRRNSNNSSGIYKVKSLLDDPIPNNIQRSKSYNSTPITNTISNVTNSEKKLPSNVVKKSKSVDEGSIKKSGFFSKFGFKKKS